MSISYTARNEKRWSRPLLERTGPIRTAGGFFRTAQGGRSGVGGIPLVAAEDAVVAAVRMAYSVAEAQVDRSTRLAQRLRKAGDNAVGAGSDRHAVDVTEQLVFKAMMGGLMWLEAAAAEGDSPLNRFMVAQYRLLGSLLGVPPSEGRQPAPETAPGAAVRSTGAAAPSTTEPAQSDATLRRVKVVLNGVNKRPVRIRRWEVASETLTNTPIKVQFFGAAKSDAILSEAYVAIGADGRQTLSLTIQLSDPLGVLKAAVCDATNEQIGFIEIEL